MPRLDHPFFDQELTTSLDRHYCSQLGTRVHAAHSGGVANPMKYLSLFRELP